MYSILSKRIWQDFHRQTYYLRQYAVKQTPRNFAPASYSSDKLSKTNNQNDEPIAISITSSQQNPFNILLHQNQTPIKKDAKKKEMDEFPWRITPILDTSKLMKHYMMLSKIRLTSLVVMTSMAGYAMAPAPFNFSTFVMCSVGTALVSSAANSINQFFEVPFDAQMSRTKNRVLVKGILTPAHAIAFAIGASTTGLSILYFGCNSLTAALGASNLILYTLIYTPMKRVSILNTWVGSIVGAIPPLMGWVACSGSIDVGAWILAGLLYAWQFPHFNALSWNLRPDYSRAGYRMMSVTNPALCRRVALRYTGVLTGLSLLAPVMEVTNIWFALESLPLNFYFSYLAWKFYKNSDSNSSRKLFRFSLLHLPVLMFLFLVNKKHWICSDDKIKNNEQLIMTSNSDCFNTKIEDSKFDLTKTMPITNVLSPVATSQKL